MTFSMCMYIHNIESHLNNKHKIGFGTNGHKVAYFPSEGTKKICNFMIIYQHPYIRFIPITKHIRE